MGADLLLVIGISLGIMILIVLVVLLWPPQDTNIINKIPSTSFELLEYIIEIYANEKENSQIENVYTNLCKDFQTQGNFKLLGILDGFKVFRANPNRQSLEKMNNAFKSDYSDNDFSCYEFLYSNLLKFQIIIDFKNLNNLPIQRPIKPMVSSGTKDDKNYLELKNALVRIIDAIIQIWEILFLLQDMRKNEITTDLVYSNMLDLKQKLISFKDNEIVNFYSELEKGNNPLANYFNCELIILGNIINIIAEEKVKGTKPIVEYINKEELINLTIDQTYIELDKSHPLNIKIAICNKSRRTVDNAFIKLDFDPNIFKIDKAWKQNLGPIDVNQSIPFEFNVILNDDSVNKIEINAELGHSSNGKTISKTVQIQLSFLEQIQNWECPYDTKGGRPLDFFVGRKSEISLIRKKIENTETSEIIGFYGLPRVGKTALLYEIMGDSSIKQNAISIYFNMNRVAGEILTNYYDFFLSQIYEKIESELNQAKLHLPIHKKSQNLANNVITLLELCHSELIKHNKKILLFIDEYQEIEDQSTPKNVLQKVDILRLFKQIAFGTNRIFIILSGYFDISTLNSKDRSWSEYLGKGFISIKIDFLSREEINQLVLVPNKKFGITVSESVMNNIFEWTQGYPWFVQVICEQLFELIKEKEEKVITDSHFKSVINLITNGNNKDVDLINSNRNFTDFLEPIYSHLSLIRTSSDYMHAIVRIIAVAPDNECTILEDKRYVTRDYIFDQFAIYKRINKDDLYTRIDILKNSRLLSAKLIDNKFYFAVHIKLLEEFEKNLADVEILLIKS